MKEEVWVLFISRGFALFLSSKKKFDENGTKTERSREVLQNENDHGFERDLSGGFGQSAFTEKYSQNT